MIEIIKGIEPSCDVYLFGSRADDNMQGGDIDLIILGDRKLTFDEISKIRWDFITMHGDQKIDILTFRRTDQHIMKEVALTTAISL